MTEPQWKTSTYCQQGECAAVARTMPGVVLVCDTKDCTAGTLSIGPGAWSIFLAETKRR